MEVKPGYKQTEVGIMPKDWPISSIRQLGEWFSGGTPSKANDRFWDGDIPWVSAKDMKVARLKDSIDHITEAAIGNGTRLAPKSAILIVIRGMILAHTFPVAIVDHPLAFNQDLKALVVGPNHEPEFILHWFRANSQKFLDLASASTHGTKRLPTEDLHAVQIALPLQPEQRAIAAALSDVDALLGALERLIAKKRDLKQAAMQQLLTGQTRLPGFTGKWNSGCIGEVALKVGSGVTPTGGEAVYKAFGRPFLRSQNIGWGRLLLDDVAFIDDSIHATFPETEIQPGDVFLNITGASIGRAATANSGLAGGNVNQHVCIIRAVPGTLQPQFLNYVLLSPIGQRQIDSFQAGGNRQGLNFAQVRSIQLPLPEFPEQTAIASVLSDMDAELSVLEQRLAKTRVVKQGMMQELLTGRIRLV